MDCTRADWPSPAKARERAAARVITYVVTEDYEIYLLSIYDKGEYDTVDTKAMKSLVAELRNQKRKG